MSDEFMGFLALIAVIGLIAFVVTAIRAPQHLLAGMYMLRDILLVLANRQPPDQREKPKRFEDDEKPDNPPSKDR